MITCARMNTYFLPRIVSEEIYSGVSTDQTRPAVNMLAPVNKLTPVDDILRATGITRVCIHCR